MKIEKLYTLSQFVDLVTLHEDDCFINSDIIKEAKKTGVLVSGKICETIYNYNNFLKQPLKKEMFVNEIEYPIDMYYRPDEGCQKYPQEHYLSDLESYQEAEKKVIFERFELKNNSINYKDIIHVFWYDNITQEWKLSNGMKTINDLAELLNNSELKLKNVEI